MLDILCDFLIATKDVGRGVGVQYPKAGETATSQPTSNTISPNKIENLKQKPKGPQVKPGGLNMMPRP